MYPWALESSKLDALFDNLDAAGILDESSDDQVVIFSRFKEMILAVGHRLDKAKVKYGIISGETKNRRELKESFQDGRLKIMLVVTSAGGVSLTLDAADTAHFIEPSWAPDEQEQAEDRLHRASRMHQVMIYTYIARDTIDEYITETAFDKAEQHERILDIRRKILDKQG
jgi:SNF2 family DNA or RNA helicase